MLKKAENSTLNMHFTAPKKYEQYPSRNINSAVSDEYISSEHMDIVNIYLERAKLELIEDRKIKLVEQIKSIIIELVHFTDEQLKTNFSDYLSEKLNYHYTYMANVFSKIQGITIEKFIIQHKIERVKELLIQNVLNLSEISYKLHYSSVSHLSNQFKKVTGITPSAFQNSKSYAQIGNSTGSENPVYLKVI